MADKSRYPQIPSTVWWGVRAIIQRTPTVTVDERLLSVQLSVQEVAARAYVGELRSVGILTDENKATPLAQKWRLDDSYAEAVREIIQLRYPKSLIDLAPPGEAERQKVVTWFLREGLGQGAAGNKAATYLLISSPTPNEAARSVSKLVQEETTPRQRPTRNRHASGSSKTDKSVGSVASKSGEVGRVNSSPTGSFDAFPLNVNVQIHISADAGTEQIDSIFQAMKRYLYDAPNT